MNTVVQIIMNGNSQIVVRDINHALRRLAGSLGGESVVADNPVQRLAEGWDWHEILQGRFRMSSAAIVAAHIEMNRVGEVELVVHDLDAPDRHYTSKESISLSEPGCPAYSLTQAVLKLWTTDEDVDTVAQDIREEVADIIEHVRLRDDDNVAGARLRRLDELFAPSGAIVSYEHLDLSNVSASLNGAADRAVEQLRHIAAQLEPTPTPVA